MTNEVKKEILRRYKRANYLLDLRKDLSYFKLARNGEWARETIEEAEFWSALIKELNL